MKLRAQSSIGLATSAAAMVLLAACGTTSAGGGNSAGTTGGSGALASCKGTITVASDFPTSGSDASDGVPTANAAKLAVDQANVHRVFGGCLVKYTPLDDASLALGKHDPQKGAQNMIALVGSGAVGVVGPFNSSVAKAEMPIANQASLVLISPSNTNPGLTIPNTDPDIDTGSLRPTGRVTYFRTCSTDIGQGRGFATSALGKLHARTAYVIDDQETYGKGLADQFTRFYEQGGGKVAKRVSLPGATKDYRAVLTEAKGLNANLVFFGGTTSNGGGIIKKEMADLNLNALYLGGAVTDDEFFAQAGPVGDGAYGGFAAPDVTKLPSASRFLADYRAAFNAEPGVYSANAYDAMNIILAAARKVITDNGGMLPTDPATFRSSVRDAVARTDYNGAIGHTTFDAHGDTTNLLFTLEVARNQKWVYDSTVQLTASP